MNKDLSDLFKNIKDGTELSIRFHRDQATNTFFFPFLVREGVEAGVELNTFMRADVTTGPERWELFVSCLLLMEGLVGPMIKGMLGLTLNYVGAYDHQNQPLDKVDAYVWDQEEIDPFSPITEQLYELTWRVNENTRIQK